MIRNIIILLFIWNVFVFLTYALDKFKAMRHMWRIPEKVLLSQAIFAGGIGAFLAGQLVRHKTRKWYFWLAWIIGLIVDFVLIVLIFRGLD